MKLSERCHFQLVQIVINKICYFSALLVNVTFNIMHNLYVYGTWKINTPLIIGGLRAFAHHSILIHIGLILVPVCAGEDLFITGGEAASEPGL